MLRPKAVRLIEINQELTERLLLGTTVDGVEGWDHGRDRTVQFIDWEHPERNDFLVVNQFRVDEPGGQGHKYIAPDLVLFVNGIPLVVIEAKSPTVVEPMVKAIRQLRRYANQRGRSRRATSGSSTPASSWWRPASRRPSWARSPRTTSISRSGRPPSRCPRPMSASPSA